MTLPKRVWVWRRKHDGALGLLVEPPTIGYETSGMFDVVEYTPTDRGDTMSDYECPKCWGTGEIDSDDSGDESWWDCYVCKGTGKLADRRRPDPTLKALTAENERLRALLTERIEAAGHIERAEP